MQDSESWTLPPLRSGYPASADLIERRRRLSGAIAGEGVEATTIGGVRCLVVAPALTGRTILYLHGGGYRMGNPEAWVGYTAKIAAAAQARVVIPDYRLAPEHPFPAALHDAAAVCAALSEGPVVVAGDSAGGGLAAALAITAHAMGQSLAGTILLSPMLDLTARDDTYASRAASDPLFSREAVLECADLYLQGHPATDPLVSPGLADPIAFPPTLLLVGGGEVLLGETLAFAQKLALADRRVSLHVAPAMGHVWPMMAPDTREAADAFGAIGAFADAVFA